MKHIILALALAPVLAAQPAPKPAPAKPAARVAVSHNDIKMPPLNDVKVPQPERYITANGMTVFLLEDHELPLVRASAIIRVGDRWEPMEKAGLAGIAGSVMRTGGSTTLNGDKLDEELDRLAASVESRAGGNSSTAGVSALKEDAARALTILADVLRNPAFPQDKIDLAKIRVRDGIGRRNDDADSIHGRELNRLIYGKNSPYARQEEYATIDSITRDDLIAWHKKYYQPENVILGVWGDFRAAEMKKLIESTLGAWPKGGNPKPPTPEVDRSAFKPGVYFIPKDDVNQSSIAFAMPLGKQNDPDYYALSVMTSVFGGGFNSRMFSKIRTEEGLAYAAYAHYAAGYDYAGTWSANVGTKSESTMKAIQSIKRELARITSSEVTDAELQLAKDSILKSAAFDFDSTAKIVQRLMTYEYYGYPPDFFLQYRANVQRITKADVLRVAKKYLNLDGFALLVLGKAADFDQPLSTLGEVKAIDIAIPPPGGAKPAAPASADSAEAGMKLLARAKTANGGAKIDTIKDFTGTVLIKLATPQGEVELNSNLGVELASGRTFSKLSTPMGEISQGFDGMVAWAKTPQGIQEAPPSQVADLKKANARQNIVLLQRYDKGGHQIQASGKETIDGRELDGVILTDLASKDQVTLYFDPATGLLGAKRYNGQFMGRSGQVTEAYYDYKEFDGLPLPTRGVIMVNGQKTAESRSSNFKFNIGIAAADYTKPAQ
jgi:predicted Zn-dependent peptidase